jgi:alpha,alpha-trehalase
VSLENSEATWSAADWQSLRAYIKQSWTTLRRSNAMLLASAYDPKVKAAPTLTLYIARDEDRDAIAARLQAEAPAAVFDRLDIRPLPADPASVPESAMLYLPHPYIVPGGRFNEMYGWDSYFTLLGLVRDGELPLARAMTDNCLYEIEHYGMVLNANRTYYLTRSQPPFVTQMLLEVYKRNGDYPWLASAWPALEKYHAFWMREPHLTPETGLSRYHGGVATPAPEVLHHEMDDAGRDHYDRVRAYYRTHAVGEYAVARYYDAARDALTPEFYLGDRAMRESGFDLSARFGPFSAATISYNSVDINCLLCQMEQDMAEIAARLGRQMDARQWQERARWRAGEINRLMWNEREGLYFDYNFEEQRQSDYRFDTTFYPLWAGIASAQQAARVAGNLPIFERAWGLSTSDRRTAHQWDAPFGWAPLQWMAVEGLRRYGFASDADRISRKFIALVVRDFKRTGTVKEKYDVEAGESDIASQLQFGYASNEVGFGWTNAVVLALAEGLRPSADA